MKKLKLTIIALSISLIDVYAQCPGNGTHTDPTSGLTPTTGGATPSNNTFQQNTFDWRGIGAGPLVFQAQQNLLPPADNVTITNPFYSSVVNAFFVDLQYSDFNPEHGWELIKQDLGYFYYNGQWNGGILGSNINGDPRKTASNGVLYFVLYNKYSAILRIFAYLPNLNQYNSVNVTLRFLTEADFPNSTYINSSDSTQPYDVANPTKIYYQPHVNALFNHYNTTTSLALDQKTITTSVTAPALWPSINPSPSIVQEFVTADFQLSYDPCICLFHSGFEVDFSHINTASLELTGTYAGTSTNDNLAIAKVASDVGTLPNGSIDGSQFISSVFNDASPTSVIQNYESAYTAYNNSQSTDVTNGLNALQAILGAGSDIAEYNGVYNPVTGAITTEIQGSATQLKDALDGASKVTSFFSGIVGQISGVGAPPAAITIDAGYLQATGQVTAPTQDFDGSQFRIGVPGSIPPPTYNTLPEYAHKTFGNDLVPNYPMYNEPLGLFALLKTPVLNEYRHYPSSSNYGEVCYQIPQSYDQYSYNCQFFYGSQPSPQYAPYPNPDNADVFTVTPPPASDYFTFEYNPASDLVYALSPLVDVTASNIYVAYEIDGMPLNFSGQSNTGAFTENSLQGFVDVLPPTNYGNDPTYHEQQFTRNRTGFVPISCNTTINTKETFGFYDNNEVGDYSSGNWNSGVGFVPATNLFYNNGDLIRAQSTRGARLVLILDLVSVPDMYNNIHRTSQIIKYDCAFNSASEFVSGNPNAFQTVSFPTDITIQDQSYPPTVRTKFSLGTITIKGNIQDIPPTELDFVAQTEISLLPTAAEEFNTLGEFGFYTQDFPPSSLGSCYTEMSPLASSDLTNYCKNSGAYAANQNGYQADNTRTTASTSSKNNPSALTAAKPSASIQTKLGTNMKLGIFPNPTNGALYINLSAQNAGNMIVNITDVNGRVLISNIYSAIVGANTYNLDLSTFENGVYAIAISDDAGTIIKQDKIILTK